MSGGPRLADYAALAWREWRHHPWQHAAALLAIALGVALASSVQLINASALAEFGRALRASQGEPDLSVVAVGGASLPDQAYAQLAGAPGVQQAVAVIEFDSQAQRADQPGLPELPLRVLGVDGLEIGALAPALQPRPAPGEDRLALLDPANVFLNAAARRQLGVVHGQQIALAAGARWQRLRVAGWVAAGGPALAVMDLSAAQDRFGFAGRITRVDLRLAPGAATPALAPGWRAERPQQALERAAQLSRAYRVNLGVLALVALLVGGFLVYSVVALSVARRIGSFALLGVLGMTARERRRLVALECLGLGVAGSTLGLAGGLALAGAGLRWLAGDLGAGAISGLLPGTDSALQATPSTLALFFGLGVAATLAGGWWPARAAQRVQPARALKGYSSLHAPRSTPWPALLAGVAGLALAFAPPIAGLPLAAYAAVACLLGAAIAALPWVVQALLARWPLPRALLPRLALQRAAFQRQTATAVVAGVVAALALAVALTVMVGSFRHSVEHWLDRLLPADLYVRSLAPGDAGLPQRLLVAAATLPGVAKVQRRRLRLLTPDPDLPPVALLAREFGDPAQALPLLGAALPAGPAPDPGLPGCYVSEAMQALHRAETGTLLTLPLDSGPLACRVRGVWRDYARQFGSVAIELADYQRHSGDTRIDELALRLAAGASEQALRSALQALAQPATLELASAGEMRQRTLRVFDRSFAVTRWLQAVAIAIGLVGVAASLAAQVAARRKEFGLLVHLGLTRRQIVALVVGESTLWLAAGTLMGLALGLAVSALLIHVVNPQSFHWSMDMRLPGLQLAALALAVLAGGSLTAAFSARHAASGSALRAVQEEA